MAAPTPAQVTKAVAALKDYDFGRPMKALHRIEALVKAEQRYAGLRPGLVGELAKALGAGYSVAARQFLCEQLWVLGDEATLPAIAQLLADTEPRVVEAACYAIGRRPSAQVDAAVRSALANAGGNPAVPVVELAGERRDPGCVPALVVLIRHRDAAVSAAAIGALGQIATPDAIEALRGLPADRRRSGEHALLRAAQVLGERGSGAAAMSLAQRLAETAADIAVRRGASNLARSMPGGQNGFEPLFNGRDFSDWIVDTPSVWSVRNGVIRGRSPGLSYNEFLRTRQHYADFVLTAKLRLIDGYGNSGIQFRSAPVPNSHEVSGYQADAGGRYWGGLYDESRRKKMLAAPEDKFLDALDEAAWHSYSIDARGPRIRIEVDGVVTVDYVERDSGIAGSGFIALQVHSDRQPVEVWFKDLRIRQS